MSFLARPDTLHGLTDWRCFSLLVVRVVLPHLRRNSYEALRNSYLTMEAIIVSGMPAVGKTTVSKLLADALGLRVVGGGDVLKEMAAEEGYKPGG